ncbi:DUF3566 domain-containing protein [Micrococcoides hystricis]|uniref:DUF3566 domain-containing protein n=1 Tax=Micrococcoides hystricis TaxID=1572761 RepID=A0ABV6PBI0_9MICC
MSSPQNKPAEKQTAKTKPVTKAAAKPGAGGPLPKKPSNAPAASAQGGKAPAKGGTARPALVRPAPKAKVRKARLLISKVDPWSVLKMSFLLSVALGIITVVCAVALWTIMDLSGIFDRINELLGQVLGSEADGQGFEVQSLVSLGQVASVATIIAVINVVLLTAISMLIALAYNISSSLVGGIGVTLTDD